MSFSLPVGAEMVTLTPACQRADDPAIAYSTRWTDGEQLLITPFLNRMYDRTYIITTIITIYVQLKRLTYHVQTYQVLYSSRYYLPRVPPCHTAQSLNYWDSKCLSSHFLLQPHREKRGCSAKWCIIAPEILFFSNWAQIRYSNPEF